ncbi:TetR/AcrR family transcriptional regulator [Erwiniaceae bacterium BAC15a-03b]|uniref:TetR/AcrR family transcriptional regulator n=1 Tax=Winslowiella arboricola TaxID=2978220 RepID=A0A9J6PP63_9GAMM|nr:TetR/AcrR family transcriptional regulator [Winslowiella arboricola]MCU5771704.1 TetR/AcrR family transcriptional regulator [Winslowiella arboricola]MCU5778179.1 TetR/AcrR family transcriptional regulator [Winslowiella arboricola]
MEHLSHKARTRQRILDEAASAMRVLGTEGIGVAALMKRAGLTHGGFYAHFRSRDELVAETIDHIFAQSQAALAATLNEPDAKIALRAFIDLYLSDKVRLAPEQSCPLPALSGEAARLPEAARARFDCGVQYMHQLIRSRLHQRGESDADVMATSALAELIGAMSLARACPDEQRAAQMLASSRHSLKQRLHLLP